jgi:hypothetical protein
MLWGKSVFVLWNVVTKNVKIRAEMSVETEVAVAAQVVHQINKHRVAL